MAQHPRITELAMNPASLLGSRLLLAAAGLLALAGCRENPIVDLPNARPIADAKIIGPNGPIDETVDGGPAALKFDFDGTTPVQITLDGSSSVDKDGEIVKYQWLSGTSAPDGGLAVGDRKELRLVPDVNDPGWPADQKQVQIQLTTQGVFSFSLWVIDNKGAISTPDTIKVTVGQAVDPVIGECVSNVLASVQPACANCVCGLSEMCRTAVVMSACDANCWGLIQCIGAKCPDFRAMAAMMPPDYSCLTTNCSDFLSGATAATAAGMCVTMCPADCTSMPGAAMMPAMQGMMTAADAGMMPAMTAADAGMQPAMP
jgi:hypothetical protein